MSIKEINVVFKSCEGNIEAIKDYYHFMYDGLIPILKFNFDNPNTKIICNGYIGLHQKLKDLCIQLNINLEIDVQYPICLYPDFLDFKTLSDRSKIIEIPIPKYDKINKKIFLLEAYDVFMGDLYYDKINNHALPPEIRHKIINKFKTYAKPIPTYDVIYIRRHVLTADELIDEKMRIKYRRSIQNSDELEKQINNLCIKNNLTYKTAILEESSLLEQFYLFNKAKIVIGQHGAAFANTFYMEPNNYVVEISKPFNESCIKLSSIYKNTRHDRFPETHIMNYATHWSLHYRFVDSMSETIGNIQIDKTINVLTSIINTFNNPEKTIQYQYIHKCIEPYIKGHRSEYTSMYWKYVSFNERNNEYSNVWELFYKYYKYYKDYKKYYNLPYYYNPIQYLENGNK